MTGQPQSGQLVAVVGPSGVGKDTLISALASARPDIVIAQRIITRAADAGGEDHLAVSEALFDAQLAMGRYAFHWGAHGLRYAIPASINAELAQGRVVVFNGSRKALPHIAERYPQLLVLMVTAPPEMLERRLRARGRENTREIAARLKRAELSAPQGAQVIVNDGSVDVAVARMLGAISRPERSA
ncbi:phosphonate metabolism protein/1,5-bisphosphokinase (PRPP-forming) PhnN [Roseinatronobacter alkalisoli]|uniref:Ribose 1,5-bisphosphate phosphokinase PhnN n=1 Tax=Roseinatronobacter alkalisoli TaxID=3028235 RepID=A0ABT5T6A6_9RHOB|nr:phosphonate metabolism protein/1,5-bisphosphokinase (PRPP-forming) PhnN [Roseinatronobacter sp. HJB301]MDD7970649.1 phosphonate metabolism protein/1,5-bisphosphokinase (PRPP-forming) PhnN [Roseinatronobacter sp. HJB301]